MFSLKNIRKILSIIEVAIAMLSGKQLLINTIEIYSSRPSILPQKWWHPQFQVRSNNVDKAVTGPHKDHYKDQVHGLASSQEVCVGAESLQCCNVIGQSGWWSFASLPSHPFPTGQISHYISWQ